MTDSALPAILVLQARAEARAYLFATGEWTIGEALEPLEHYADKSGVLDEFDLEIVDAVILAPFLPFLLR